MNRLRGIVLLLPLAMAACAPADRDTIARLRDVRIEIREEDFTGGLEKAMAGYQHFLEAAPDSALAPEAMRRLADLKVEREYGLLTEGEPGDAKASLPAPERASIPAEDGSKPAKSADRGHVESETDFERRTTATPPVTASAGVEDDLERAGALEAIALYEKLLKEYPLYERNDQVLYQMSRAYEELGRIEEAMTVMDRLIREFPESRYIDEVQFRRAEYFFSHRQFLHAEEAYAAIAAMGVGSSYYELALYKLGWTFYKQELYEDALHRFIGVLDYKVSIGYDFDQGEDEIERKRLEDTFRVISLSFSNLGGAQSVVDYFERQGQRSYEDEIYRNLGEFYVDKRRYSDAAETYSAFVERNPFHEVSPHFHMRIIEIHMAGGFPTLVIDAKKAFASTYSLQAPYWEHFDPQARPEVLGYLKTNITDLASHYHALYQDPKKKKEKGANFREARHWYREFLGSFPAETESPGINYRLADLLLENRAFGEAAVEYEKTAYAYPLHEKASKAGYAAVYAYREHLAVLSPKEQAPIKREVVRSSLAFAETFPEHEKAAVVLGAAADDLYKMEDYPQALSAGRRLIEAFPGAETEVLRSSWLVVAHSSYELQQYAEAETAYLEVLERLPAEDSSRAGLVDNLAAAIYKQGEAATLAEDFRSAADHFLRVGVLAPTSTLRPTAEYDAAAALIQLEAWKQAAAVLGGFRELFPGHELQPEVTKKIAYVYKEDGRLAQAAEEYERIERESENPEERREALLLAAELYQQVENVPRAVAAYRRYVELFPEPAELNIETRNTLAGLLKAQEDRDAYHRELRNLVAAEDAAGEARTARTRHLAAHAALVLAELTYDQFLDVRLVKPFKANLQKKQGRMKEATQAFSRLLDYEVGEVTAAATFYLAEIYAHFSVALMESERPEGLNPLESEQYELAIEDQAYPFQEKAIEVHEKNMELISVGIYNTWVERSLQKLAVFVPARYDKSELASGPIRSLEVYTFEIQRPESESVPGESAQVASAAETPIGDDSGESEEPTTETVEAPVESPEQIAEEAAEEGDPLEAAVKVDEQPAEESPESPAGVEQNPREEEPAEQSTDAVTAETVSMETSVNLEERAADSTPEDPVAVEENPREEKAPEEESVTTAEPEEPKSDAAEPPSSEELGPSEESEKENPKTESLDADKE